MKKDKEQYNKYMFTKDELTNNIIFLKRTQVTGNEAIALVQLLSKLSQELDKLTAKVEELPAKKK